MVKTNFKISQQKLQEFESDYALVVQEKDFYLFLTQITQKKHFYTYICVSGEEKC